MKENDLPDRPVVVITRSSGDSAGLKDAIERIGLATYDFPTIGLVGVAADDEMRSVIGHLEAFRYIIFTSGHGVDFFIDALAQALGHGPGSRTDPSAALKGISLIAIGTATAQRLAGHGLKADHVPEAFTGGAVADMMKKFGEKVRGAQVLLPRSELADAALVQALEGMGARPTVLPLYTAQPVLERDPAFERLLAEGRAACITFTSPSTVAGFSKRLGDSILLRKALRIPALCIGPTTAAAARECGFEHITVPDAHTAEGMASALGRVSI
jgi:uroporphyrinogen III methyltransferase/synthase